MIRVAEEKKEKILEQAIQDAEAEISKLRDEYDGEFQKKAGQNTNNFSELDKHA